jgi:hypothetical protein
MGHVLTGVGTVHTEFRNKGTEDQETRRLEVFQDLRGFDSSGDRTVSLRPFCGRLLMANLDKSDKE